MQIAAMIFPKMPEYSTVLDSLSNSLSFFWSSSVSSPFMGSVSFGGFVLKSTKYQSLGVGLPFSQGDGDFREEDGWFIMDNMNRNFPELSIRNGVTNEEKVYVGDKEYELSKLMPLGKELHLYVAPLYKGWYMKKEIRS